MLVVGLLMVILLWKLVLIFLAVVERRLIPAWVRGGVVQVASWWC